MKPEQVRQITRGFTEQPETRFIKDVVNESEPWKKELTKVSESVHYKGRHVTELEANLIQPGFEVKALVDPKHFDMIYNSGATETLNKLQTFLITYTNKTEHIGITALDLYKAVNVWMNNERKNF